MADTRSITVNSASLNTGAARVDSPVEMRRFFNQASETLARADIALPALARRFVSKAQIDWQPAQGLSFEIPKDVKTIELPGSQGDTPEPISAECNVILFLKGQILVCVRSELVSIGGRILTIHPPWTVFKIQRRKEARYDIPKAYEFYVKIGTIDGTRKRLNKRLLDLSSSGLAILASTPSEAAAYKNDLIIKGISLQLEDQLITLDAQVRNTVPLDARGGIDGFKVGLKILRMGKEDRLTLSGWVARRLSISYT